MEEQLDPSNDAEQDPDQGARNMEPRCGSVAVDQMALCLLKSCRRCGKRGGIKEKGRKVG